MFAKVERTNREDKGPLKYLNFIFRIAKQFYCLRAWNLRAWRPDTAEEGDQVPNKLRNIGNIIRPISNVKDRWYETLIWRVAEEANRV